MSISDSGGSASRKATSDIRMSGLYLEAFHPRHGLGHGGGLGFGLGPGFRRACGASQFSAVSITLGAGRFFPTVGLGSRNAAT